MSWYTENVEKEDSDFGSDFGLGTIIPSSSGAKPPSATVVSIIGLVAIGALSYGAYKMISHIGDEHERLTPRRRY